ncbi:MAG: pilus assembly protein PilM [Candidatus Omnitrophica bacterium]|nr:pilus assembly protein PilM [Candidatus Omnitrophota bacterium]
MGKSSIVGLDIGPREIRVVTSEINEPVILPLKKAVSKDCVIVDPHKAAEELKNLLKSQGIKSKDMGAVVWGRGVVLRLMKVPAVGTGEVNRIIKQEASKYMVFAGSDLLTDFCTVEEINENGIRQLKILSVAAKREIIDSYVETIKLAGLNLRCIEASSIAIARALFLKDASSLKGAVVLAAVEYDNATIFIFKDGKIHYLHKADTLDELQTEMESITAYCRNEFGEEFEVKEIVSSATGELTAAEGITLRESPNNKFPVKINLLPVEELKESKFNVQFSFFIKVLAIVAAGIVVYFSLLYFQMWNSRNIAKGVQKDLERPVKRLEELLRVEKMDSAYSLEKKKQEEIIKEVGKEDWVGIFAEIKRVIPKDTYLASLVSNKRGEIVFKGEAISGTGVFDLVRALKESTFFKNVELEESKDTETEDASTRAYFVIKCDIRDASVGK